MDIKSYFIEPNEINTFYQKYKSDDVKIGLGRGSFIGFTALYNPEIEYKPKSTEIDGVIYNIKEDEKFKLNGYKFLHYPKVDTTSVDKNHCMGLPEDCYQVWILDNNENVLDKLNILNKNKN